MRMPLRLFIDPGRACSGSVPSSSAGRPAFFPFPVPFNDLALLSGGRSNPTTSAKSCQALSKNFFIFFQIFSSTKPASRRIRFRSHASRLRASKKYRHFYRRTKVKSLIQVFQNCKTCGYFNLPIDFSEKNVIIFLNSFHRRKL